MLDQALINQLRQHFAGLESKFTLQVHPSSHPKQDELLGLLEGLAEASEHIEVSIAGASVPGIKVQLFQNGKARGVFFEGVPGGHEFTSLVLAILHADGKGRLPDQGIIQRIRALKGPIAVKTYISLTCTNCPDVVQALNIMALFHDNFSHTMVDGALVPHEVEALGIQGVPCVVDGSSIISVGKTTLGDLLEVFETRFGKQEIDHGESILWDVLVLGGGPAGVSAAVYSARKGLKTALVAQRLGGQVNDTQGIENFMGTPKTTGPQVVANLRAHLADYEISVFENRRVESLTTLNNHTKKVVKTSSGEVFEAQQVIVATGAQWRELGVPGEKEYLGRGVAFCPHCDGPFFVGKKVAVIGGGNSGIEAAIDLAGLASEVTVFEFADTLKADGVLVAKAQSLANISIHTNARTMEILGSTTGVRSLRWENRQNGSVLEHELDGVFVQIGLVPNSKIFHGLLETNKMGEVLIDSHGRTAIPGVYAAGDVSTVPYKQIVISMGEGAKAALSAFEDRVRNVGF